MAETSNANKRLAVLQRHLASATIEEHHDTQRDAASAELPSSRVIYDFLVRDNAELREAIFDFMKASCLTSYTRMTHPAPTRHSRVGKPHATSC